MARILIQTEDERLLHTLTLLLSGEHTITENAPSLLLTDEDAVPAALCHLPVLRIGNDALPRPFSHASLLRAVREIEAGAALPPLTPTEARLFEALCAASPAPLSREELKRAAFGEGGDDRMLNLYIHYLRKKLESDGVRRIFSSRGKGYYYDANHTP